MNRHQTSSPGHLLHRSPLSELLALAMGPKQAAASTAASPSLGLDLQTSPQHGSISASAGRPVGYEATQVEDAPYVHLQLDPFSGRYVLIHQRTGEHATLEPGDWSLHELDGYAGLINASIEAEDAQGSWATDYLEQSIFIQETNDGPVEVLVRRCQAAGEQQQALAQQFDSACAEFQWHAITWPCGQLNARFEHKAWQYMLPRQGCRWWWRLQDIHSNLGLKACAALPACHSRWVSKRMPSWMRWVAKVGMAGSVTKGISKGAENISDNPAGWASCSTHALVAILSRCAFLDQKLGGLSTEGDRAAATPYLQTLLHASCGTSWSLDVFCAEHGPAWEPPKLLCGGLPVSFAVDAAGMVGCVACWEASAPPVAKAFAEALGGHQDGALQGQQQARRYALWQMLQTCLGPCTLSDGSKGQLLSLLFMQLCIRIGGRLEVILMALSAKDLTVGSPNSLHGVQLALAASSTEEARRAKTAKALGYWNATQEAASIHAAHLLRLGCHPCGQENHPGLCGSLGRQCRCLALPTGLAVTRKCLRNVSVLFTKPPLLVRNHVFFCVFWFLSLTY